MQYKCFYAPARLAYLFWRGTNQCASSDSSKPGAWLHERQAMPFEKCTNCIPKRNFHYIQHTISVLTLNTFSINFISTPHHENNKKTPIISTAQNSWQARTNKYYNRPLNEPLYDQTSNWLD